MLVKRRILFFKINITSLFKFKFVCTRVYMPRNACKIKSTTATAAGQDRFRKVPTLKRAARQASVVYHISGFCTWVPFFLTFSKIRIYVLDIYVPRMYVYPDS